MLVSRRIGILAAGVLAASLIGLSPGTSALAAEGTEVPPEQAVHMREEMTRYGVDTQTQDSLIEALNRGESWESLEGGVPVSRETVRLDSTIETIERYSDGSIIVTVAPDLEAVAEGTTGPTRSVSGCSYSGSSYAGYWKNCRASVSLVALTLRFSFDYQNIRDTGSSITNWYDPSHVAYGGSFTGGAFSKKSATSVRYSGTFTLYNNLGSNTAWIQANVSGNVASTTQGN